MSIELWTAEVATQVFQSKINNVYLEANGSEFEMPQTLESFGDTSKVFYIRDFCGINMQTDAMQHFMNSNHTIVFYSGQFTADDLVELSRYSLTNEKNIHVDITKKEYDKLFAMEQQSFLVGDRAVRPIDFDKIKTWLSNSSNSNVAINVINE